MDKTHDDAFGLTVNTFVVRHWDRSYLTEREKWNFFLRKDHEKSKNPHPFEDVYISAFDFDFTYGPETKNLYHRFVFRFDRIERDNQDGCDIDIYNYIYTPWMVTTQTFLTLVRKTEHLEDIQSGSLLYVYVKWEDDKEKPVVKLPTSSLPLEPFSPNRVSNKSRIEHLSKQFNILSELFSVYTELSVPRPDMNPEAHEKLEVLLKNMSREFEADLNQSHITH